MTGPGAMPDPEWALRCLAADHLGLGGAILKTRDPLLALRWVERLASLLAEGTPVVKLPAHAGLDRILGGLDIAETLARGTTVAERGLLERANGGILVILSAERLDPARAVPIAHALDAGEVALEREGLGLVRPARLAVIAIDGSIGEDEAVPALLRERLAFAIPLEDEAATEPPPVVAAADAAAWRSACRGLGVADQVTAALCQAALALGAGSLRAGILALRTARALAAIDGSAAEAAHAALAARLVLAHRATRLPAPPPEEDREDRSPESTPDTTDSDVSASGTGEMGELVLDAVRTALPEDLLRRLEAGAGPGLSSRAGGGAMARQAGKLRGRPTASRPGTLEHGARLNLIDTLRAAAPWQKLRRQSHPGRSGVQVRRDDFRITRFRQRHETTVIFAVDASGSAAAQRLAEAKGAVELLLADCYVRRDRVALIAFRGRRADVLLPPTRSLQRARRALAELPGGGGTPLASAVIESARVAEQVRRTGGRPLLVFLTDGKANITRDGTADRIAAFAESEEAARSLRAQGHRAMVIDVSGIPHEAARRLAVAMAASYLPLPHANATAISRSVSQVMQAGN